MVMPLTSATFSIRRLTLLNALSASMPMAGTTPTCRAAARVARALATLCWPVSSHSTTPWVSPSKLTSKREPSSLSNLTCHWPPVPVVCTGVQQPMSITRCNAGSVVGWMTRPSLGMVRTRWWNWRSMAGKSGKISAWSNSRLFRMAVRGR
ncbi:hypothetical protein D3C86_1576570 [compost metagenome]